MSPLTRLKVAVLRMSPLTRLKLAVLLAAQAVFLFVMLSRGLRLLAQAIALVCAAVCPGDRP